MTDATIPTMKPCEASGAERLTPGSCYVVHQGKAHGIPALIADALLSQGVDVSQQTPIEYTTETRLALAAHHLSTAVGYLFDASCDQTDNHNVLSNAYVDAEGALSRVYMAQKAHAVTLERIAHEAALLQARQENILDNEPDIDA